MRVPSFLHYILGEVTISAKEKEKQQLQHLLECMDDTEERFKIDKNIRRLMIAVMIPTNNGSMAAT